MTQSFGLQIIAEAQVIHADESAEDKENDR